MNNKNDKDEFPDRSQLFEGGRVGVLLIHGLLVFVPSIGPLVIIAS